MNHSLLCVLILATLATALAQTVDPQKTTVIGSGLKNGTVGIASFILIQPRDSNGNPITNCYNFTVTLTSSNGANVPVNYGSCVRGGVTYQYNSKLASSYNLTITYNNNPVANSPYLISLAPGPISVPSCVQSGLRRSTTAGGAQNFSITAYDVYGNRVYSCPPNYWTIVFSGILNITVTNYTCSAGLWQAYYNITRAGPYLLWVSAEKLNIANSPFPLNILAGPVFAPKSFSSVSSSTVAGKSTTITITTEDIFGNYVDDCSNSPYSDFTVYLVSPNNTRINVTIASCDSGIYTANVIIYSASSWSLYIFYQNVPLSNSGLKIVVSAYPLLYGPNSIASGSGFSSAIAGVPSRFVVIPYDQYGNRINQCLDTVSSSNWTVTIISLDSQNSCTGAESVCSIDDATYTIQYTCQKSTNYTISVLYLGNPIKNSGHAAFVYPGVISGPNTVVSGAGLTNAYAGEDAPIELDAFDQYNNKITTCVSSGSTFVIDVVVPGTSIDIHGTINTCLNGNYFASYVISQLQGQQTYSLVIRYQGNTIKTSFVSTHPGPPSFNNCNVMGKTTSTAGDYSILEIQCSDQFNNPITSCIDNKWIVQLNKGDLQVTANYQNCTLNPDQNAAASTFFSYTLTSSGVYFSNISYVGGYGYYNTFKVLVNPSEFFAQNSIAVGLGVYSQALSIDNNATFSILSRDKFGNNVTNCSAENDIQISIAGQGSIIYPAKYPCSNGIIPVSYHAFKVGGYAVNVNYKSYPISGSPYQVTWVAGKIFNNNCKVSGTGLSSATAGERAYFSFYCEDQYSNIIYQCNTNLVTDWKVNLVGGPTSNSFIGNVSNCNSGTYQGWWYAEKIGIYSFQILYLGFQIAGTNFSPVVSAAAINSNMSIASGQGLSGTFQAGSVIVFSIQAYDRFGNPNNICTQGDNDIISIFDEGSIIGGIPKIISSVQTTSSFWTTLLYKGNSIAETYYYSDCSNGTYTVRYSLNFTGDYVVVVNGYDRGTPKNTPGSISIIPGPPYPPQMWGDASDQNLVAGGLYSIKIIARDAYKNNITTCISQSDFSTKFLINALPQNPSNPPFTGIIANCSLGVYYAVISVKVPNQVYSLHAKFNSTFGLNDVQNSPWIRTFTVGSFNPTYSRAQGLGVNSTSYLIAGYTQNFQVLLYNQYNIPIYDTAFCNSVTNLWRLVFTPLSDTNPNHTISLDASSYCNNNSSITITYNVTRADYYGLTVYWHKNQNTTVQVGGGNNGVYNIRIRAAELIPSTIEIGNIPPVIYTSGNFSLVGYDHWGNLADFSGAEGSKLSIDFSPHCVPNYPPVCTPGNSSYICHFNASVGGVYCLSLLYDNHTIGNQSVYSLLVQGGYLCSHPCLNNGFCLVTDFGSSSNVTNSTSNTTNLFSGITTACHCGAGFTGNDCSVQISKHYMRLGLAIGLIVGLALLLLIIGLIIGFFIARSRNKDSDYLNRGLIDS